MNAVEQKKATWAATEQDSLIPLLEGTPETKQKHSMLQAVMAVAKTFEFDPSLMEESVKVLEKERDSRGAGFDETCMDQIKASFKEASVRLESQLAEGAPTKAERAGAVGDATKAKAAAEQKQEELVAASQAAKEEKEAASEALSPNCVRPKGEPMATIFERIVQSEESLKTAILNSRPHPPSPRRLQKNEVHRAMPAPQRRLDVTAEDESWK